MDIVGRFPGLARLYRRVLVAGSRIIRGIDPDKVVFCCFDGRQYGDNPGVISRRLHERRPEAKQVWLFTMGALERLKGTLPDYVTPLYLHAKEAYMALGTARVWVDNFTKENALRWKKGRQFYIQTWHGDRAIKKICYDLGIENDRRIEESCDRVVTGSSYGEGMFRTAFRYRGKYIRAGSPRNDVLVKNDPEEVRRCRGKLGIDDETGLLLYAPTYRDNDEVVPKRAQMDLDRTLRCLEQKTGRRWMCLYRAHYLSKGIDLEAVKDRLVDVSGYGEMSELLMAADMVLTDYSSCAMDYILRDRPAIFYTADWREYTAHRGIYFDVHDAPFLQADSQQALEALIMGLTPEAVRENCRAIREHFGYYETGRATDAVCDYMIERLGNRKKWAD